MATTSCPSSFKVSGSPTGSKSPPTPRPRNPKPPPPDPSGHHQDSAIAQRELNMLVDLMEYRDGVMSEATAQATGIIAYFQGLAGFTDASHPQTTDLCIIALN